MMITRVREKPRTNGHLPEKFFMCIIKTRVNQRGCLHRYYLPFDPGKWSRLTLTEESFLIVMERQFSH